MDRGELSAAMIQELGAMFAQALGEAAPTLARADLDGIERRLQAVGRQVVGQVVEQVLAARAALVPPGVGRAMRGLNSTRGGPAF